MEKPYSPTVEQKLSATKELETSIRLVGTGLDKLKEISGAEDFFFLPMLLLSSGFERMMKTVISLHAWFTHGVPSPSKKEMQSVGHNLVELKNRVVDTCFGADYLTRPVGKQSLDFFINDPLLARLLHILSMFGEKGRYYDLDEVSGEQKPADESPERLWERVELDILQAAPDWKERISSPDDAAYRYVIPGMVVPLDKFAKTLCFLVVTGGNNDMRQCTAAVPSFVKKNLGKWELPF